ncbi:Hint domain-containing protein [Oceanomicrobium pacificus]|uniref:Hedgehog/Intein (Hint) domain-containing protein n=1 Tax=Oceanomicrobium pacificus TaxID=2692916 RepID=A0A6B0TQ43_9RHOB|nr:Hint domain-containing protein [Oceanomicrobium pacificus]MXU63908.1 hypothetical protein [Oceanomicrobium pacificus]
MALNITGPSSISIDAGQNSTSAQYVSSKTGADWFIVSSSSGTLGPDDYTVSISDLGVLTVNLEPGADVPPGGANIIVVIRASTGPGQGNNGFKVVRVRVDEDAVPCFVAGTLIATPDGLRRVEEISVGDMVLTRDAGPQPVVWRAERRFEAGRIAAAPWLWPVRIAADRFGPGRPARPLFLSPQHRVLIGSAWAELCFGSHDVLAHAVHLCDGERITRPEPDGAVTYVHFACRTHQIVWAEGLPVESLYPGEMALRAIPEASRSELQELFPELAAGAPPVPMACRSLRGFEAQAMVGSGATNRH